MTRTHEKGRSEITDEALLEAARTGRDVCEVLEQMLRQAKKARNRERQMKIIQAQKFLRCRNQQKRGKKP